MENKKLYMTMLFDFFGDLLTEKQRHYFDLYYNEDFSLSEIAENEGISRQGVRDNILRAEALLTEMEDKTGILRRYSELQSDLDLINGYADEILALNQARFKSGRLQELAMQIKERIPYMKG